MSSVSSVELFRTQIKLVMKVGNTLMKINNRTRRILNNRIGNMRMIDAAMVTKALLRKLPVLVQRMRRAVNHISNSRASMLLFRKHLEAANSTHRRVPWLALCNSDLDSILFWKALKK